MKHYKHLIITRFMCDNFIKEESNIDITSEDFKEKAFDMAKRHIIRTLENQSDKNFTLVFLVGDNITDEDKERIWDLSEELDIEICYYKYLKQYIDYFKNYEYLITSRLDYDDHVYCCCVEDIHKVLLQEPDVKIWGLNSGITIIDGDNKAYFQKREAYEIERDGFCAPMLTLILKRSAVKEYFDVYKLGFHIDAVSNFLAIQSHYMIKNNYTLQDVYYPLDYYGHDIYFIWIRHENSASYVVFNVTHTSSIKIDISEKELRNKFGYVIEK